jgi:hypothetical protein
MRYKIDQELMLDRFRKEVHELTPEERNFLVLLEMKLTRLEKDLKCEIKEMLGFGEQRAHDGATGLGRDCIEVEWVIDFFIGEDDPAWDDEQDNILAHLSETCGTDEDWEFGIADGENHNEFQHTPAHPMKEENHCWLYHGLYHHASLDLPNGRRRVHLDWGNLLRIDSIGVDLRLIFQSSMDI